MIPDGLILPKEMLDPTTGAVTNVGKMGTASSAEQKAQMEEVLSKQVFRELLPRSPLKAGYPETSVHFFAAKDSRPITHLRINYFPDGGVARLRVFGEVEVMPILREPTLRHDFASALHGGAALCWSNEHYGTPSNCLLPGRAPNMGNGWETARNPNRPSILELGSDGNIDFSYSKDWFIMKLGMRCDIDEVEIDTYHFKGNFPESALIEVCDKPELLSLPVLDQRRKFEDAGFRDNLPWQPLLKRTKMAPDAQQYFKRASGKVLLENPGAATHVRLTILPDGGVSRLRMHGTPKSAPPPAKL